MRPPALCSKLGSRRGGGGRLAPCSRGAASQSGGRLPPDHLQLVRQCYTRPSMDDGAHALAEHTGHCTRGVLCVLREKHQHRQKCSSQRGIGGDPHSRPRERRLTYGRPARFRCVATATAPSSLAALPPPTLTFHVRMRAAACFTAGPEAQAREEGRAESTAALAASAAASREEASPLASSPLMRTYAHSPQAFGAAGAAPPACGDARATGRALVVHSRRVERCSCWLLARANAGTPFRVRSARSVARAQKPTCSADRKPRRAKHSSSLRGGHHRPSVPLPCPN